jgi:hypothetical protein
MPLCAWFHHSTPVSAAFCYRPVHRPHHGNEKSHLLRGTGYRLTTSCLTCVRARGAYHSLRTRFAALQRWHRTDVRTSRGIVACGHECRMPPPVARGSRARTNPASGARARLRTPGLVDRTIFGLGQQQAHHSTPQSPRNPWPLRGAACPLREDGRQILSSRNKCTSPV